jgi:LEA14-like dessication related protein
MKKSHGFLSVCTATCILAAASVLAGCTGLDALLQATTREPVVSLKSTEITGIDFTGLELLARVNVENPNGFDIPFPEVGWELFVNSNAFVKGVIENGEAIKSRGATIVNVPVKLTYEGLYNTFQSLKNSDDADFRIAAGLKFDLPILGTRILNLEHTGKLPILKAPSIGFKGISVKSTNLNPLAGPVKADLQLDWEVENNNTFAMTLKELGYNFKVNNAEWGSGRVPDAPVLAPKSKTLVPVVLSVNGTSLVTGITRIIAGGGNISYTSDGNIRLSGDLPGLPLPDFDKPFNFSGTTKLK